jgi:hypothetical protein
LVRVRIWEWPEQNGIDHAENCGIRANAKRQRQDRNGAESWLLQQLPEREL